VKLFHPALNVTIDVTRESKAAILERSGWRRVDAEPETFAVAESTRSWVIEGEYEMEKRYHDEFVLETEDDNNSTEEDEA